jgi:5-carboxymethyl-2-hydroxymuconate isomerase
MPHLVILYTANLDQSPEQGGCDMNTLCRALADTMLAHRDEMDRPVFPVGGVRVMAYPATHFAVADGGINGGPAGHAAGFTGAHAGYAFVYLNLRMGKGRSALVHGQVGAALEACCKSHFATQLAQRPIGITLQIDEGPEVFDAKNSSLHPMFNNPKKG